MATSSLRDWIACIRLDGHKDESDLDRHSPEHFVDALEAPKKQALSLTENHEAGDQAQYEEDQKVCAKNCPESRHPDVAGREHRAI